MANAVARRLFVYVSLPRPQDVRKESARLVPNERERKADRGSELPQDREQVVDNRQAKLFADVEMRAGSGAHKKDEEP